ncbi:RNA-binding protein [Jeotgalibacillus soli]|uniref:RNA-binding protein S4 n=1 Tax=Jeotgalibacillus soli TaxID=889306 RepID=A0A0C2VK08_9BACL|nr:RNA-binding protein [Jeotgalibacillus soli]KIL44811.1 RNA-binding protein S4 [Jeotgalibacillus soli]
MSSIYQHFRKEEKEFIDQVLGWKSDVELMYAQKLTDFLDPRQRFILESLIGSTGDILVSFAGGEGAERKRALIYPSYYSPTQEDFQLQLLEIVYPSKFVHVEHKHVLGSIMALGVKREKFGDILFTDEMLQLVVAKELSSFMMMNFTQIGKSSIKVNEISWDQYLPSNEKWQERFVTLSSLRLDVVMAGVLNLSRQKAKLLIQAGKVKVNFREVDNTSFECAEGDMLSVRGLGRCRIGEIEGKTKKDKWRLNMYILGG